MFDNLLKTIFNETDNESNSSTKNETVNKSNSSTKNKTVNESNSNTKNESKSDNEIRQLNNWFETIDQTKSLKEQIELLKEKGEFLSE